MEQTIAADAGDENIGITVVVEVADGDADAVHGHIQSNVFGDILECAVALVAIEGQARRLRGTGTSRTDFKSVPPPGQGQTVDEQQILMTVAVVVNDRNAGAHRLRQEFLSGGAVEVVEVKVRGVGDIGEAHLRHGDGLALARGSTLTGPAGSFSDNSQPRMRKPPPMLRPRMRRAVRKENAAVRRVIGSASGVVRPAKSCQMSKLMIFFLAVTVNERDPFP